MRMCDLAASVHPQPQRADAPGRPPGARRAARPRVLRQRRPRRVRQAHAAGAREARGGPRDPPGRGARAVPRAPRARGARAARAPCGSVCSGRARPPTTAPADTALTPHRGAADQPRCRLRGRADRDGARRLSPAPHATSRDHRGPRPGLARARRRPAHRARRGPHAGLRPAGDEGHRQGAEPARGPPTLGYDMVLGNTFHLFLDPGHELIARARRPARVHALGRARSSPTPAASRSSRWATARSPTRSRAAPRTAAERHGKILAIDEEGVRFRSYLDGSEQFLGPETSMEIQAALGSDIALVFDECTPFNVNREYTARSTERTHRWLTRCLDWHAAHGPEDQLVYGIVQGGVHEDLRTRVRAGGRRGGRATASRSAARSAPTSRRCTRSSAGRRRARRRRRGQAAPPARASATSTTSSAASSSASTPSTARCRRAWAATAWRSSPSPTGAGASTSPRRAGATATSRSWRAARARPARRATPAATCATCVNNRELTGLRLLTLHNLAFVRRVDGAAARRDRWPGRWPRRPRRCAPAPRPWPRASACCRR